MESELVERGFGCCFVAGPGFYPTPNRYSLVHVPISKTDACMTRIIHLFTPSMTRIIHPFTPSSFAMAVNTALSWFLHGKIRLA